MPPDVISRGESKDLLHIHSVMFGLQLAMHVNQSNLSSAYIKPHHMPSVMPCFMAMANSTLHTYKWLNHMPYTPINTSCLVFNRESNQALLLHTHNVCIGRALHMITHQSHTFSYQATKFPRGNLIYVRAVYIT